MKKIHFVVILLCACCSVQAQYYDAAPQLVLGFGPAIPTGVLGNQQQFGGYGAAQLRLPVGSKSDFIITAQGSVFRGSVYMEGKKRIFTNNKLLATGLIGYRYFINPLSDPNSFYIQGDAGLAASRLKSINPTVVPSFGYLMHDRLDLSVKYQAILSSPSMSYITIGIAYGFHFD